MKQSIKSSLVILVLIGFLFTITGCVSLRDQMLAQGYNSAYIDGFEDGQSSGYSAANHPWYYFRKNTYRYEQDSQYRQGWNDGFQVAKGRYEAIGRAID